VLSYLQVLQLENIADYGAGPILLDENWYTTLGGGFGGSVINEFALMEVGLV
jgi:hypothetical protein